MTNLLLKFAQEYINFSIEGKKVNIPYCIVSQKKERKPSYAMARTGKYSNYAGKGSPEQIRTALLSAAKKKPFDLTARGPEEITAFMIHEGIGIDCSGFVYNVLDTYLRATRDSSLDRLILRYPGILGGIERLLLSRDRVRRSSAATLTSDLNTTIIEKVKDIQLADMMRLTHSYWKGKHIAIIVDIHKKYITYAHTSEFTKTQGPHLGKIVIVNPEKGLESQAWLETTQTGVNYGEYAFDPRRGDSVRRLKYLA